MFSKSLVRGANCDCNSAEACLPSAVLTMACRALITPTLPVETEPAVGALCAWTAGVPTRHAAARAAMQNILRCDREAVSSKCDREAVNLLEFTLFSLLWLNRKQPHAYVRLPPV